uniref:Serpentine receptor class gamma n=1 Tax=Meloidogyne hapla TaxID=6305 RepID=A0A1I8B1A1_MELHA
MSVTDLLTTFEIITIIFTTYSIIISTPIYVSVLVYIRRLSNKPPFNSPFYTCFIALGIIDLICYWLYLLKKLQFWGVTLPFFQPYGSPTATCSIIYFFIWFTGMAQWELNILISLNRFVSLMFPNIYQKAS